MSSSQDLLTLLFAGVPDGNNKDLLVFESTQVRGEAGMILGCAVAIKANT